MSDNDPGIADSGGTIGPPRKDLAGRGSIISLPSRFDRVVPEPGTGDFDPDEVESAPQTEFLPDSSRSIVSENDSPDVPFRYSLNPYRGCEHGCAYCYARPSHEYLGLSAGLDFETKIFVKHDAPDLFREFLCRDGWQPESITFSGITDCYQPAERRFGLTRACLQVALESRQPVSVITKNARIVRDVDVLSELAAHRLVDANISLTTLDEQLARTMEPRTATPSARLRTIRTLADAGIPVRVMVAPTIPGLNDSHVPAVLEAARDAGAASAGWVLLRLPGAVKPIFLDWLERAQPTQRARVESLIRATRGGALSDPKFGSRMRGAGEIAEQIARTFRVFARKLGLDRPLPPLDATQFRPPKPRSGQLRLF